MDVGTTPRRSMSQTRRLKIFEAHKGICVLCKTPIDGVREPWIVEHLRALGLGGEDKDSNCGPAHESCRREKDKTDVAAIAKAKRVKSRHLGIAASKRPIQSRGFPLSQHKAKREASTKLPLPDRRPMFAKETT